MLAGLIEQAPRFFSSYNILLFAEALLQTVALSVGGGAIGLTLGGGLAVLRHPHLVNWLPARLAAGAYIEIFRRVPFLLQLLCVFFGFQLAGLRAPMFVVALTAVSLSATAFAAELVRTGLGAVHRNQLDAAAAMNFSRTQTLTMVMLPQAWSVTLPPMIGYLIGFIKSTSIASQVDVLELTYAAKIMNTKGFSAILCFGTILVLYFALCYPLSRLGAWAERYAARRRGSAARPAQSSSTILINEAFR